MKFLVILFITLMCLMSPVYADILSKQDIHIEWTYDFQPKEGEELQGFKMYMEGIPVCEWDDPLIRTGDCVFYAENGEHSFYLSAVSSIGESPQSPAYGFTLEEKIILPLESPIMTIKFIL